MGIPHRTPSEVMKTMTTLMANNASLWCQTHTKNILTGSLPQLELLALKLGIHCTEILSPTTPTTLHKIPTRILQKIQLTPLSIAWPMMMTNTHTICISPTKVWSQELSSSLQPLYSDNSLDYRVCLTALTEACKWLRQCWPLIIASMQPMLCHPVASTPTMPQACKNNYMVINPSCLLLPLNLTMHPWITKHALQQSLTNMKMDEAMLAIDCQTNADNTMPPCCN